MGSIPIGSTNCCEAGPRFLVIFIHYLFKLFSYCVILTPKRRGFLGSKGISKILKLWFDVGKPNIAVLFKSFLELKGLCWSYTGIRFSWLPLCVFCLKG